MSEKGDNKKDTESGYFTLFVGVLFLIAFGISISSTESLLTPRMLFQVWLFALSVILVVWGVFRVLFGKGKNLVGQPTINFVVGVVAATIALYTLTLKPSYNRDVLGQSDIAASIPDWTAIVAVVVASLSLLATVFTLFIQRRHNRKSVVPVAEFILRDYENHIQVALANKGIGPMIVTKLVVRGPQVSTDSLVTLMPKTPDGIMWSHFTGDITNRCLSPSETIVILELNDQGESPKFDDFRDEIRSALRHLTIHVSYRDVYDEEQLPKNRSLEWFGRNLKD